jgi:hypothetical protein
MNEQEEFFSPKHKRLLNIATWAKYLAWIALVFIALGAFGTFFQNQASYVNEFAQKSSFIEILKNQPMIAIKIIIDILNSLLKGVIYYLLLKGISLGLNMIVETDINYREQKQQGGAA